MEEQTETTEMPTAHMEKEYGIHRDKNPQKFVEGLDHLAKSGFQTVGGMQRDDTGFFSILLVRELETFPDEEASGDEDTEEC